MAVLASVPVAAFAQVPGVNQVVGGVTDTTGGVVQAPALPALPANPLPANPLPVQPPAAQAPAVHAPAVQAPAVQAPAVQAPAVQAPAVHAPAVQAPAAPQQAGSPVGQHSSPAGGSGSSAPTARTVAARGGHSRAGGHATRAGRARHGGHSQPRARASADTGGTALASADTGDVALADKAADPLPSDPRPARSPFTGLALGLLFMTGMAVLGVGFVVRRGTGRLGLRRAT